MDNNTSDSDDETSVNDDEMMDCLPFPPKCPNEVVGIDSLLKCFQRRYDDCPAFFMGTLRDACLEAFSPTQIKERRPVLIYIHNDESLLSPTFCKNIFCSTMITDYLLDHYIVWPWDITFQSNRNTLTKIWGELFSTPFINDFSIEQCPLLIGIQRLFEYEIDGLTTTEYQFQILLKDNIVTRTQVTANREAVLNELAFFKKQCNKIELDLSFNFVRTTGLCWEIILDIVKYLSLNDAISVFSTDILPLLNNPKLTFQLSDPSLPFLKMVHRKFQPEQIVSLQLTGNRLWLNTDLAIFTNVVSLTLLDLPYKNQISQYKEYFPNLTCLSLWYDNEIDFSIFHSIFNQLWRQIKRLEIHSAGVLCTHYSANSFDRLCAVNSCLEYFLFDVGHFPLTSINNCFQYYESCFLKSTIGFIKKMIHIHCIRLVINKYDVEQLLDENQWKILIDTCPQLKKITLQMAGRIFHEKEIIEKAGNIQTKLYHLRETIQFQMKFL